MSMFNYWFNPKIVQKTAEVAEMGMAAGTLLGAGTALLFTTEILAVVGGATAGATILPTAYLLYQSARVVGWKYNVEAIEMAEKFGQQALTQMWGDLTASYQRVFCCGND